MIKQQISQRRIGQEHLIKLLDKKIKVQLQYNSPFRKESKTKLKSIHLNHFPDTSKMDIIRFTKMRHVNPPPSATRYNPYKYSPQFYQKNMQESRSILEEYQKFHAKMFNNETEPRKIKVYSNSKELKTHKDNQINISINLKQVTNNKEVPVRKIKLYSPNKKQKQNIENASITVKLHQQKPLKATPERKYKIEVTSSSKSRSRYDSVLSNKQRSVQVSNQQSFQASRMKKIQTQYQSPSHNTKTLHSFCLHQK